MPVKVSVIPYLNTIPFLYGLQSHEISDELEFDFSVPSLSADKIKRGEVDIGIIPVAEIPNIKGAKIISDYCIGAEGKVASVLLCSGKPLEEIEKIFKRVAARPKRPAWTGSALRAPSRIPPVPVKPKAPEPEAPKRRKKST